MEIIPLAAESMGVRSMAVLVRTDDVTVLVDPGVRLAPLRFGLKPHKMERERRRSLWKEVRAGAKKADVITISHYHYDHHEPDVPSLFRKKTVLLKHPTENINKSQEARAEVFVKLIDRYTKDIRLADGNEFVFGNTTLTFSEAVPHGTNDRLGYVVQLAVAEGEMTFVHTSDVEGPSLVRQADFLLSQEPKVAACDGPMTYMMHRYGRKALEASIDNLVRLIRETPIEVLILDHHLLRDLKWREKITPVFEAGEEHGCAVKTFAEFAGMEDDLLEARRKELYGPTGKKSRKRKPRGRVPKKSKGRKVGPREYRDENGS
jgi:predicted metallo-beta-lactamase superfamily hydrolase